MATGDLLALSLVGLLVVQVDSSCSKLIRGMHGQAESRDASAIKFDLMENCHPGLRRFEKNQYRLEDLMMAQIRYSYYCASLAAHFSRATQGRTGFGTFFKQLSGEAWGLALKTAKYINDRGGGLLSALSFKVDPEFAFKPSELESLAHALKHFLDQVDETSALHSRTLQGSHHDAHLAEFLSDELLEVFQKKARAVSGMIINLHEMMAEKGRHLAIYLFDQQLSSNAGLGYGLAH